MVSKCYDTRATFEYGAVQKRANLIDIEKCCTLRTELQNLLATAENGPFKIWVTNPTTSPFRIAGSGCSGCGSRGRAGGGSGAAQCSGTCVGTNFVITSSSNRHNRQDATFRNLVFGFIKTNFSNERLILQPLHN